MKIDSATSGRRLSADLRCKEAISFALPGSEADLAASLALMRSSRLPVLAATGILASGDSASASAPSEGDSRSGRSASGTFGTVLRSKRESMTGSCLILRLIEEGGVGSDVARQPCVRQTSSLSTNAPHTLG